MSNTKKVAVYGTLREGQSNWAWALKRPCSYRDVVYGYMVSVNDAYPGLRLDDTGEQIYVEVYEVTDEELQRLDRLEGYRGPGQPNMYNRVFHDKGFYIYTYSPLDKTDKDFLKRIHIGSCWVTHMENARAKGFTYAD